MVQPRPGRYQHRRSLPRLDSSDQPRLVLTSAILKKRTLYLSEFARAYPTPDQRRVAAPKHDLLHRIKRLWRFTDNERVDALETQAAFVAHVVGRLGFPRLLGLAVDWTFFDTTVPSGLRMRYLPSCVSLSPARGGRCRCCNWPMIGTPSPRERARTNSNGRRFWPWF